MVGQICLTDTMGNSFISTFVITLDCGHLCAVIFVDTLDLHVVLVLAAIMFELE